MSASSVKEPFNSPDWIFETKLDGYRAIAVIDSAGKARVWSRNRLPLESKFPMVQEAVNKLKLRSTILDGEIVALDAEGIPRFQLLQRWQKRPTAPVCFYLFDLLWCDGRDFTSKTVMQRRERLKQIVYSRSRYSGRWLHRNAWNQSVPIGEGKGPGRHHREAQEEHVSARPALPVLAKDQVTPPETSATRARQYAHSAGRLWRSTRQVVDAARSGSRQPQLLLTVKDCLLT
jgi:hypothetical protein